MTFNLNELAYIAIRCFLNTHAYVCCLTAGNVCSGLEQRMPLKQGNKNMGKIYIRVFKCYGVTSFWK